MFLLFVYGLFVWLFGLLEIKKLANTKNGVKLKVVFYTLGLSPFKIKNMRDIKMKHR